MSMTDPAVVASGSLSRLCAHTLGLDLADVPPAARRAARYFLTDTLACALAGSGAAVADRVHTACRGWGTGPARVVGFDDTFTAHGAATLAGFAIHCLEWDAVHEPAVVHAMSVTTAALLTEVSHRPTAGRDLLAGVIIGVDIAAALGLATGAPLRFFRPATAGLIGATAALARLRGFDERRLCDALGLAYGQVGGTMQAHVEGTSALAMQVALAARAAVTACDLAAAGVDGPHDIFDGPFGYFTLIEDGGDAPGAFAEFGKQFAIEDLSIKPYPSGRASHAILSTLLDLGPDPATIARLTARVPPLVHRLVARPVRPLMRPAYARLCLPFLAGLALTEGRIDPRRCQSPETVPASVFDLAARVDIMIDDNPDPNALFPQALIIERHGQPAETYDIPATLGAPDNPLSPPAFDEKFAFAASLARRPLAPEGVDRLRGFIADLEEAPDCRPLFDLVIPPR